MYHVNAQGVDERMTTGVTTEVSNTLDRCPYRRKQGMVRYPYRSKQYMRQVSLQK